MISCSKCGVVKPTSMFTPDTHYAGGFKAQCRECRSRHSADRCMRRRRMLEAVKLTAGCTVCGYDAHAEALDFDHRPGVQKVRNLAAMVGWALPTIWAEVMKCDVVCANCHRVRTTTRRTATQPLVLLP
jgi:hypothetical protein